MIVRIIFFFICVISGFTFGFFSFENPKQFLSIVDMLVSILSMIVGVSLAVAAILGAAPSVKHGGLMNASEVERVERIIGIDDQYLYNGQFYSLVFYFVAIMVCVFLKWHAYGVEEYGFSLKLFSGVAGGLSLTLILWSLRLPLLLRAIVWQRRGF